MKEMQSLGLDVKPGKGLNAKESAESVGADDDFNLDDLTL